MTEKELQDMVLEACKVLGLLAYHTHDSRRSQPGFPDLVIVGKAVEFWELKAERGKVSAAQRDWILRLRQGGCYAGVFRPSDWSVIEHRLRELAA